tara:strand:+ start:878 stop:1210 length:333 start_codon:yes stop_codon:yes gene_type:complete
LKIIPKKRKKRKNPEKRKNELQTSTIILFLEKRVIRVENLSRASEIIEMAWCDKTSFNDIETLTGLSEKEVIRLMRQSLKASSFRLWRQRVAGRAAKHNYINRSTERLYK